MSSLASPAQNPSRLALAPVRDSRLNIRSPLSQKTKRTFTPSLADVMPATPTGTTKKRKVCAQPQTVKAHKSVSFSDFRSGVTPSKAALQGKPNGTNATAGLAATKLKLKLQLAFYKLQHNTNNTRPSQVPIDPTRSHTQTRKPLGSPTPQAKKSISSGVKSHLPTPPKLSGYSASANMNLQTKERILLSQSNKAKTMNSASKKGPSLSVIAYDKNVNNFKQAQNLRLFSVKKNSEFYHEIPKVPLAPKDLAKPNSSLAVKAKSEVIPRSIPSTTEDPMIRLPKPMIYKIDMESSNMRSQSNPLSFNSMALPPINKILKTPMKNSSSTRNLVASYLQEQKTQTQSLNQAEAKLDDNNNQTILYTDETIDEDEDGPLRESTCNSIKVTKKNPANLLSSSPIRNPHNSFATPNSFSVAKSLLQLGSGWYN